MVRRPSKLTKINTITFYMRFQFYLKVRAICFTNIIQYRALPGSGGSLKQEVDFYPWHSEVNNMIKNYFQNRNHCTIQGRKNTVLKHPKLVVWRSTQWLNISASIVLNYSIVIKISNVTHPFTQGCTNSHVLCVVKDTTETIT